MKYLSLVVLILFSFLQKKTTDYERDLKLILSTSKFGVNKLDMVDISITNLSNKDDYRISYLNKPDPSGGSILYIHFNAFMKSKSGKWDRLVNRIDKELAYSDKNAKKAVNIRVGKKLDLLGRIFNPRKWFFVEERTGEMKLIAEYIYKQMSDKETKDSLLLKIPSFTLRSDTLRFLVGKK